MRQFFLPFCTNLHSIDANTGGIAAGNFRNIGNCVNFNSKNYQSNWKRSNQIIQSPLKFYRRRKKNGFCRFWHRFVEHDNDNIAASVPRPSCASVLLLFYYQISFFSFLSRFDIFNNLSCVLHCGIKLKIYLWGRHKL